MSLAALLDIANKRDEDLLKESPNQLNEYLLTVKGLTTTSFEDDSRNQDFERLRTNTIMRLEDIIEEVLKTSDNGVDKEVMDMLIEQLAKISVSMNYDYNELVKLSKNWTVERVIKMIDLLSKYDLTKDNTLKNSILVQFDSMGIAPMNELPNVWRLALQSVTMLVAEYFEFERQVDDVSDVSDYISQHSQLVKDGYSLSAKLTQLYIQLDTGALHNIEYRKQVFDVLIKYGVVDGRIKSY